MQQQELARVRSSLVLRADLVLTQMWKKNSDFPSNELIDNTKHFNSLPDAAEHLKKYTAVLSYLTHKEVRISLQTAAKRIRDELSVFDLLYSERFGMNPHLVGRWIQYIRSVAMFPAKYAAVQNF